MTYKNWNLDFLRLWGINIHTGQSVVIGSSLGTPTNGTDQGSAILVRTHSERGSGLCLWDKGEGRQTYP